MELEPVAIRSGVYSPCRFESYTLRLRNIYIKQKTRNLTRIPIFAMIGGVRMCDLCKDIGIGIPDWDFLTPDKNGKVPSGNKIEIRKIVDKHALVFTNSAGEYGAGVLTIAFCPICGRKLV